MVMISAAAVLALLFPVRAAHRTGAARAGPVPVVVVRIVMRAGLLPFLLLLLRLLTIARAQRDAAGEAEARRVV